MSIVLITGSREWSERDRKLMLEKVSHVVEWCLIEGHTLIVGDAEGVDIQVQRESILFGVTCWVYGAYGRYRHLADKSMAADYDFVSYPHRDREMARICDICVAVWNGTSRGTKITMDAAEKLGKRVIVRKFD